MRTPRYQQIADALRTRILAGEFAAGRLLPSESGLGSRYDASRVTIRRALEQLRDEGLLASRQGLGSALSRDDVEARPFYELLADTAGVHLAGASQTIVAGAASAADAELLGVPTGSPVLICERTTRSADGSSVLFSEHVYPGHRMAFTVDLAPGASSDAPAGLRLVE